MNDENEKLTPGTELDLPVSFIVLTVPDSTVELTINAKIYYDGSIREVTRTMPFYEVREAIRDGERNYIPDDALFCLAKPRKERLGDLLDKYIQEIDDEE